MVVFKRLAVILLCVNMSTAYAVGLFSTGNDSSSSSGMYSPDMQSVPPITSPVIAGVSNNMVAGGDSVTNSKNMMNGDNPQSMPNNQVMMQPTKPRPELKPNDFQKSVQIRTGLMLNQYGYNLFTLPNTFYLVNNLPIDNNYTLGPGDEIFIQGWGSIDISYTAKVSSDGTIYIPKIGTFNVAGIQAGSLESYLKKQIGGVYKKFRLSATVSKIRSIQVNVTGFAEAPGTYTVSSMTSLVNAIFAVGGPNNNGSLREIELRRNGQTVCDFDMYDVLLKGNNTHDVRLLPGDIIYFKPKGNEVAIYDGVKQPDIYEARDGENIGDILAFAGGATFDNAKTKVVLEHISNDKITVNSYSYSPGLKEAVDNGSIIHFMLMNKEYSNTVVLMGNVANPTRLQYKTGMRVSDVIPNKSALLTKSFWNSYSYNTYGYDHALTKTGLEKTTNRFGDNVASYGTSSGLTGSGGAGANDNKNQSGNDLNGQAGAAAYADKSAITAGSGKLASDNSNGLNTTSDGNNNNGVFGVKDNLFQAGPINIPEADINWNYAVIIRINQSDYSTHIIPFNLGLAIKHDPENNIKLEAGDVIDILSQKDMRNPIENYSSFVFIDGEVKSPGVYELKAGETLTDAIKRAGGITPKAFLFGLELDRLSVKKKQVKILNQMLDQAQQNLIAQSSAAANQAVAPGQAQNQQIVLQQQSALIDKMRQVKPVGRVVLKINSSNEKLADLPYFEMDNGDTVYIPPRPTTVDVIGQVFNAATFAYDKSLDIGDYIKQAGGENDYADTSNEYVLQANGIIYSKAQTGWYQAFATKSANPGDTIIVPQNMQFGSAMQNLLNWTTILSNFGMGAAAIAVFKQ